MNQKTVPQLTMPHSNCPALGFGTWKLTGDQARHAVNKALEVGYRHIDTARMYGNEREVGQGVADAALSRDQLFVTTKLFNDSLDRRSVKQETEASLTALGTDYLDLLLIHWPSDTVPLEETLSAMLELQNKGQVKNIGVSNFNIDLLDKALKICPGNIACNQVECHPYLGQEKVRNFCRQNGVPMVAYSPLARGRVIEDPVLQDIAAQHHKNPAQVVIRWFLQHHGVGLVPKAAQANHIQANFEVFDFELSEHDMQQITQLDQGLRLIDPPWAPEWD